MLQVVEFGNLASIIMVLLGYIGHCILKEIIIFMDLPAVLEFPYCVYIYTKSVGKEPR